MRRHHPDAGPGSGVGGGERGRHRCGSDRGSVLNDLNDLNDLLVALAARSPAPGGGAALAWSGALAAALLEMCARYADEPETAGRAAALRAQLLDAAQDDQQAYGPVLAALRRPAGEARRTEELALALSNASEPPLAIARAATEVAELAAEVAGAATAEVRGDALAAVLLSEAAARGAAELVRINLRHRENDSRLDQVERLSARAAQARSDAGGR